MRRTCKNCKYDTNASTLFPCSACDEGDRFEPMTNAGHIRAMSDEELAEFLCKITICCNDNAKYDTYENCSTCPMVNCECSKDVLGTLEWLQKPVKVEE